MKSSTVLALLLPYIDWRKDITLAIKGIGTIPEEVLILCEQASREKE